MFPLSYRSPKTEVRESQIHGRGLFATTDISKTKSWRSKVGTSLIEKLWAQSHATAWFQWKFRSTRICSLRLSQTKSVSCRCLFKPLMQSNLGIRGEITFVAMRDIHAGEELAHDWAMTDDDDYSVDWQMLRAQLSQNSHRERLATRGFAEALYRLFLSSSCGQDCGTGYARCMKLLFAFSYLCVAALFRRDANG